MSTRGPAVLRMLDKAEKEIERLPRSVKGAIWDFFLKFRENPSTPGLRLKKLKGADLFSARVTDSYRAILAGIGANTWLLLTVAHRSESYEDLDRFRFDINKVTGGIEFVDIVAVEDSISSRRGSAAPGREVRAEQPLFAGISADELRSLGVAEALLPVIVKLTSDDELLGLVEYAPQLTADVLLALRDGHSVEDVRATVVAPQAAEEPVDTEDYAAALVRPATVVATDDTAIRMALQGDFAHWRVFLHPTQRKLVERDYNGPARVSGGPGTGKTVVALHRVCHLVSRLPPGDDRPVLLTTYTRNLATDLEEKLRELGGDQVVCRVDVVNIDRLARRVANDANGSRQRTVLTDSATLNEWRSLLGELGVTKWTAEFLAEEWSQVILGQACTTFAEYAQVRRAGRGRALTRAERRQVWQLAERFQKRLDERDWTTHAATAAVAARIEQDRARRAVAADDRSGPVTFRYRHVVVDEAQDLHPAHWKMLRAMVAPGRNDIFCVGDPHQRIYDNVVTLSTVGIQIRGRSTRLTLNYRTTRQILGSAVQLLRNETYDDLDGGTDTLDGYRSVPSALYGKPPAMLGFATAAEELSGVVAQLTEWITTGEPLDVLAVCVPTRQQVTDVLRELREAGVKAVELTPDGPKGRIGVRVGTMHRFKGIEFQRIIIVGVGEGSVPRAGIDQLRDADPARYRYELRRTRSLLFVAATRARDDLVITWHGKPSRLLPVASE